MAYVVGQDMWLDALTHNHTPEDVVERERVETAGAEVLKPAVLAGVRACIVANRALCGASPTPPPISASVSRGPESCLSLQSACY
jgi:hypothetical protein